MKNKLFLLLLLFLFPLVSCATKTKEKPCERETVKVARVIDGDTIVLEDGRRVRYTGINAPERGERGYEEARDMNKLMVEGREVLLEYDVEKIQTRRRGRGRTLAYVYLKTKNPLAKINISVNAWLVKNGFAKVMTVKPNVKYKDLFLACERQAKKEKRGLWAEGLEIK